MTDAIDKTEAPYRDAEPVEAPASVTVAMLRALCEQAAGLLLDLGLVDGKRAERVMSRAKWHIDQNTAARLAHHAGALPEDAITVISDRKFELFGIKVVFASGDPFGISLVVDL